MSDGAYERTGSTSRPTMSAPTRSVAGVSAGRRPLPELERLLEDRVRLGEPERRVQMTTWAGSELRKMGRISMREIILAVLVIGAIVLWVIGGSFIDPTLTALVGSR